MEGYSNTLEYTLDESGTRLHDALHTKQIFLLPTVEKQDNHIHSLLMPAGHQSNVSMQNSVQYIQMQF